MEKVVSIVIPTLNSERFIEECLKSIKVIKESFDKKIEVIVVDGRSKDKTLEIIKKYHGNQIVDKYISEPDNGIFNAMNKGLHLSTGKYIMFVGSDNIIIPYNFLELLKCLEENNPDVCYGDSIIISRFKNKVLRVHKAGKFNKFKLFYLGWFPPHECTAVKKTLLLEVGGFNEEYRIASDIDMYFKIFAKAKKVVYFRKFLVVYRSGGTSNRNLKNILYANKEVYEIVKKNGSKFPMIYVTLKLISKIEHFLESFLQKSNLKKIMKFVDELTKG